MEERDFSNHAIGGGGVMDKILQFPDQTLLASKKAGLLQGVEMVDSDYGLAREMIEQNIKPYGKNDYTISLYAILLRNALFTIEQLKKQL